MDASRASNILRSLKKAGTEKIGKQRATKINSLSCQISFWTFRCFRVLMVFYKLLGFATFAYSVADQKKNNDLRMSYIFQYSKLGIVYNAVLVSFVIGLNWLTIPFSMSRYLPYKTNMLVSIEVAQVVLGSISITVILLVYCFRQKDLVQIGNRLAEVERELDQVYRLYPSLQRRRVFRVLMIACVFQGCLMLVLLIIEHFAFHASLIAWFTDFVPTCLLGWFIVQYFVLVSVIHANFSDVNRTIDYLAEIDTPDMQSVYQIPRVTVGNTYIVQQLRELRNVHAHLCDVAQNVSDFYSLPILLALFFMFSSIVYNAYYFISPFLNGTILDQVVLADVILWMVLFMYPVHLLTNSITRILDEMTRTGNSINNLMSCIVEKEVIFELQQTSLQLLHRKVYFTASGYFTLDNTLLHSMMSASTTYLVILVQFQMGNSAGSSHNHTQ